jgi:hypothetical protein
MPTNFWLKYGRHKCDFITDVMDLVPRKAGGHGYWGMTTITGTRWLTGDIIGVVPASANLMEAMLVHRVGGTNVLKEICLMTLGRPKFSGADTRWHFMVGTLTSGYEIYAYRSSTSGGDAVLVVQGFSNPGGKLKERPLYKDNVLYDESELPAPPLWVSSEIELASDFGFSKGIGLRGGPAQDDEGSGIEP